MRIIASLLCLLFLTTARAQQAFPPQYIPEDSALAVRIMNETMALRHDSSLMLTIARRFMNLPYVAHTLEVNDEERLVVNFRQLDCTTYVETVLALYRCVELGKPTFADFCRQLQLLRYEGGGVPHYTRRLHYFTSWIVDNTALGICEELQQPRPPFTAVQTVSVDWMTHHVKNYRMLARRPDWIPAIRQMEQRLEGMTFRYIPKAELKNTRLLRQTIHDGDVVVIITNKRGLDTQHLGFASWHDDGLHLLNASSIHKKIVEEPMTLRQYLYKHPTMPGIRVIRLSQVLP